MNPTEICIFCLYHRSRVEGQPCTYGLGHEFPVAIAPPKQVAKRDMKLCTKCGLHPKNPAGAANGCAHVYVEEVS